MGFPYVSCCWASLNSLPQHASRRGVARGTPSYPNTTCLFKIRAVASLAPCSRATNATHRCVAPRAGRTLDVTRGPSPQSPARAQRPNVPVLSDWLLARYYS